MLPRTGGGVFLNPGELAGPLGCTSDHTDFSSLISDKAVMVITISWTPVSVSCPKPLYRSSRNILFESSARLAVPGDTDGLVLLSRWGWQLAGWAGWSGKEPAMNRFPPHPGSLASKLGILYKVGAGKGVLKTFGLQMDLRTGKRTCLW